MQCLKGYSSVILRTSLKTLIDGYKQKKLKKLISKISIYYSFVFTSYALLWVYCSTNCVV